MKQQSHRYVVVTNSKGQTSKCWETFGFPALIESADEQPKIIEKFVTCRLCFVTYSFNSNSTRLLNSHTCKQAPRARSLSVSTVLNASPTYHQTSLSSYVTPNVTKINDGQAKRIKDLQAQWVCKDVRPFTIVDDEGFRQLAQELVAIGACRSSRPYPVLSKKDVAQPNTRVEVVLCNPDSGWKTLLRERKPSFLLCLEAG